ncbi:carbonic anhydrase [Ciceribacter ferrooxidans]|uniref:Carbonic anhydrase n=1 Tax=Ciceribacter ferrooxidans TaxID=2509717 RepID=A0A4Q2TAU8_9HYPH|nr:carbonic anhydrase [Ciceribacter ferrooxidans]RYC13999.1 carbonic anhydrase [Ciceribacter ferrooxidans]
MSSLPTLIDRNKRFAVGFASADLPVLPKLRTIILACIDGRVDPAQVLGLEQGDAVVARNNGGRVTRAFIDEMATIAVMVARMTGMEQVSFDIVLMQHTQCGAERLADTAFQATLKDELGVNASESAITYQRTDLLTDLDRLRDAPRLPVMLTVSALLYAVQSGRLEEIAAPQTLAALRTQRD